MSTPASINYNQSGLDGIPLRIDNTGNLYAQPDPFANLPSPNLGLSFPSSNYINLQPRKESFSATLLGSTTHIYTSPLYEDMQSLAKYFGDWGATFEIQEGATHTMTVQVPWGTISNEDWWISDYASEQWELIPNNESKDILLTGVLANVFSSPISTQNTVILPDVFKVAVQRAYDNKANFITLQSAVSASYSGSAFIPYAQMILDYKRFGIDSVPSYTQTLKRTAVIDARNINGAFQTTIDNELSSFQVTNGTINIILSTPQLLRSYSIPADTVGKLMLPSYRKQISIYSNQSAPAIPTQSTKYEIFAGWLIKPPTFNFISRFKIQMTQEFVWNEWIDHLYYSYSLLTEYPLVTVNAATTPPPFQNSAGVHG